MDGTWYDPILIPIVCSACLAFLIAAVVWAAYHPDWKHGGGPPSVLHNRTWLDAQRDLDGSEAAGERERASEGQRAEAPARR